MTNILSHEVSPYLQQHAENPVWWQPWSQEAFDKAEAEDKPVFLSIGYSTCYWCHVMEKESFESEEVAEELNKNFVAIKVDREERPDVDSLYMDAVVALTGRGGWPMSVFLTPEKLPFWGGTYIPKQNFIVLLRQLHQLWRDQRQKVNTAGEELAEVFSGWLPPQSFHSVGVNREESFAKAERTFFDRFDKTHGGFGSAPKFPPSQTLRFLTLRGTEASDPANHHLSVSKTLDAMAAGGIYDHVGGGFSRYSTDAKWLVPHFEKMLYDNALLAQAYLEYGTLSAHPHYHLIAKETLSYLSAQMRTPDGAFYAAEDAGEVGKEGEFYVWSYSELEELCGQEEHLLLSSLFSISEKGNFEGNNVLALKEPFDWEARFSDQYRKLQAKLFEARNVREKPHRDEKILTAWNALAVKAFSTASRVFQDLDCYEQAVAAVEYLKAHHIKDGRLVISSRAGETRGEGCVDDYAYLIDALLALYQVKFDPDWLRLARDLQEQQDERLWSEEHGCYVFSSAPDLIVQKREFFDGAIPAGNGVSLSNLFQLSALFSDQQLHLKGTRLEEAFSPYFDKRPSAAPTALLSLHPASRKQLCGFGSADDREAFSRSFGSQVVRSPFLFFQSGDDSASLPIAEGKGQQDGKLTLYLCDEGQCLSPKTDLDEVRNELFPLVAAAPKR